MFVQTPQKDEAKTTEIPFDDEMTAFLVLKIVAG